MSYNQGNEESEFLLKKKVAESFVEEQKDLSYDIENKSNNERRKKYMKLKNVFISASLLFVSGACAFTGALTSKKELVKTSAESVSTITIDTFSFLPNPDSFPMMNPATVDLEGYTFKYRNAVSTSYSAYYGYSDYEALTFYYEGDGYFNNQTAMPGDIKSITLYTHSAQTLTITYNVRFGTSAFVGKGYDKDGEKTSYDMSGSQSKTFTNYVTGATFFSIFCNAYTISDAHKVSCLDKIVVSYTVDQAKTDATTFAQTFKDTTDGICKDTSKSIVDTDADALAAVWNAKEEPDGTSLVEKWNALSNGAKAVFTAGTANATIADANARYVHIMGRYSDVLTAFNGGPTFSAINTKTPFDDSANDTLIIAVAIASLALVSIGGLIFIRKRRKTN